MTKYYVHIAETAEEDIDEALGYLITIKHNPSAAASLLEEIEAKRKTITDFPLKYQTVEDPLLDFLGIRGMPVKNYYAFYMVEGNDIYIIRFLHQKQNWKSILKEQRIPFEIEGDPFYSAQNMERLNKAAADIKAGRNMSAHEPADTGKQGDKNEI